MNNKKKRGCMGSTESEIVVPSPSWREIFLWKRECEHKMAARGLPVGVGNARMASGAVPEKLIPS